MTFDNSADERIKPAVLKEAPQPSVKLVEHSQTVKDENAPSVLVTDRVAGNEPVAATKHATASGATDLGAPKAADDGGTATRATSDASLTLAAGDASAKATLPVGTFVAAESACASGPTPGGAQLEKATDAWFAAPKRVLKWIFSLGAPLFLIAAIALKPKLLVLWILIVLIKPVVSWLYSKCPLEWRNTCRQSIPSVLRHSRFLRDLGEGADQGLPFILFWLYLCCAPFAVIWMAVHWLRAFFNPVPRQPDDPDGFVFVQNKTADSVRSENNFYYSRSFGITFLAFFALGIPAFITYSVFQYSGMERTFDQTPMIPTTMANSSVPPQIKIPKMGLFAYKSVPVPPGTPTNGNFAPYGRDATYVVGYNGYWPWIRNLGIAPSKASVFFVHFYLFSLATAMCMLFFRTWFLFPLNFLSDEHDVEFTASGIKRRSLKGWFLSVITFNRWAIGGGPDSLSWTEVKTVSRLEEGFTKLCPLPETAFKKESLSYKLLNKGAAFIDGLSNRVNTGNYLVFSTTEKQGDCGRNIRINLNDLNREQRARLFYAIKKWAPHVVVQTGVEEQLLGSTVLQDVRYTQLWFDLLTAKTRAKRQNALSEGETLKNGEYIIEERLTSGGQATAYLARRIEGGKCVLKEFILATTSNPGALIESAREFEAEVSLLSQLKNPGIVKLEDFFSEDGRVYVALEHIDGQSLRQRVQQYGALSEAEVIRIAQSVCAILEYLHSCTPPIVHRDVTPENIIVRNDGTIKLIDFSLAVKNNGQRTTDSCGKQAFTPPEQFREEICSQSDIYGLGATMYFLLTAANPKPISCSSPRLKASHVSEALNAVVEHATQLDLAQRYESVKWLKLDLDRILED